MTGPFLPPARRLSRCHAPFGASRLKLLGLASCAFGLVGVVVLGIQRGHSDVDNWGAFVVPAILLAISVPIVAKVRWFWKEESIGVSSIALRTKFIGPHLCRLVAGHSCSAHDSTGYHAGGSQIATDVLEGQLSIWSMWSDGTGTEPQ